MKKAIFIISFIFSIGCLTHVTAQQRIFKTYTIEDGLVSNPVRRIYQDSRGFIWIATWEGLSKYDGNKFTNYTIANGLSHNMVNDIYESDDGKLYIAENDGSTDILYNDAIVKKKAFNNVIINQFYITRDKKVIAATDTSGLYEIKNGNLVKPLQKFQASTYSDVTELNDSLLIGGAEGSLRILNRQFDLFSEIKLPKESEIKKFYKDLRNKVWVGTTEGLKIISPPQKNNQPFHFSLQPSSFDIPLLSNRPVNDILEDVNGNLWIATTHGLVKIQPNNLWQSFSEKDGLPSADITCIYEDKEKNIWIGTSLGLAKLVTKNDIRIYTIKNGLSSTYVDVLQPLSEDNLLIRNETGIQYFNTKKEIFYPVSSPHNFFYNGFVQNSRPILLFSNNNKFGKYDSIRKRIVDYLLPDSSKSIVYCSIMDTNGNIFNGTNTGLVIRAGESFYSENNIAYRITAMLIDKKGYLWIGTWKNGLFRIQYINKKIAHNSPQEAKGQLSLSVKDFSDLLPDKNIRSMFEDSKGNIWVGTRYQGIVLLSDNNKGQYITQHFDLGTGLTSNSIRAIAEDNKGCIWLGSNLGIDKLIPRDTSFHIFNFSRINNYFAYINAILPGKDHSMWFTTSTALTNIIDGETEKTPPLPVYITSVHLGDTSFNYNIYQKGKKVELKYNQNQAQFDFSSPGFINEKQNLYSYRLLGSADTTWSVAANLHNVSYASLQPGDYRFEVRTKGWNGQWGIPANFAFSIRPPYWQTWWFYLLIGILVVALFYIFYLYRIRQLLTLQSVRNRIATDLHDDIGSTLTNINMLSEISRKNLGRPLEAEKFLHRITEEVTATSQALNDIIWSVNTGNDSMEETMSRMRRYAADLFDTSNTTLHLNMDEHIAGKKLKMEQRRDVYLIYKELLNNIVKHAYAKNVWINTLWQNGKLLLKIEDDGKGFNHFIANKGNGLKNISARTEKWKGSTNILASPGKGTVIEIIIPLEE